MLDYTADELSVAVVTWKIRGISVEDEFFRHLRELVTNAKRLHADVVVLPELYELELLKIKGSGEPEAVADLLCPYADAIEQQLITLAASLNLIIVGGSHLRRDPHGVVNYAPIVFPNGTIFFQPKNVRTQWELQEWRLSEKTGLTSTLMSRLGVLVCYDSEFPEAGRAQAELGVELLCVPSYTESQHGYQRVNFSCRARAVENEIFVAQACLVGPIECFGLETGYGRSSIMTPSKSPFPSSAVLAETPLNEEGIACAIVDFAALGQSRASGDARPWSDRHCSTWTRG